MKGLPEPVTRSLGSDFVNRLEFFARTVSGHSGDIRVVTHDDADGICAGGVMGKALHRAGKSFIMSSVKGLNEELIETLDREENELIIILDMGSGHLERLEECAGTFLVIDHHTISSKAGKTVYLANPHEFGRDGAREVSGATMSFLVTLALDGENWDLLPTAMAGAIGDKQDIGGFTGVNRLLLELGEESGLLETYRETDIQDTPLRTAVPESLDPFYAHYCTDPASAAKDMAEMGLDPDKRYSELSLDEKKALATLLSSELARSGIRPESIRLLRKLMVRDVKRLTESRTLSKVVNACGKMGRNGKGLAIAMGDMSFMEEGYRLRREYRRGIRDELKRLCCDGTDKEGGIQYFWTEDTLRAGAICGLAMLYVVDQEAPLLSVFEENGKCKISARGTAYLVRKGLDLATACRESARLAGGQGGGHVIASGATVPSENIGEFLENAGKMVKEQLGG